MGTVTVIDRSGDKRILLNGSAIVQAIPAGFTWNTLRIGFRLAVQTAATISTSPPKLRVGLVNDPLAVPFVNPGYSPGHAVYIETSNFAIYSTSSVYLTALSSLRAHANVDGVVTHTSATNGGSDYLGVSRTVGTPWILEIRRGVGIMDFDLYGGEHDSAAAHENYGSDTHLQNAIMADNPHSFLPTASFGKDVSYNLAVDETTNGTLTHLFLSFDNTPYPLEVCSLLVARIN